MQNEQEHNLEKMQPNPPDLREEIEQKKKEVIAELNPSELQKVISQSASGMGEIIGDLFYNSIKLYFDIGFNLAKRLNFDFVVDSVEKAQKDKKNKKE